MPKIDADALTAAVEDLHHETRLQKSEIWSVIATFVVCHRDEVRQELTARGDPS